MRSSTVASLSAALFALLVACSSDDDDQTPAAAGNGVNDVSAACAIRSSWTARSSEACVQCVEQAPLQACECPEQKPWVARCNVQNQARMSEASCEGVTQCIFRCSTDCACIDACYVGKEACREKASAVDGCVAEVCAETCR